MMSSKEFKQITKQGFTVRPATLDDLSSTVALLNTCSLSTIGAREFTEDEFRVFWSTPGFDMQTSTRVVLSPEGEPVGYVDFWDLSDPPVHPWVWGQVHPEWGRRGIGTAMMTWARTRAQEVISRVPEDVRVSMMAYTLSTHEPTKALFESLHLKAIRHSWRMVIDLPNPPATPKWPQGITLRGYKHPQDAETVYRVEEDIFRDHWGFIEEPIESGFKQWLHHATGREDFDPTLWTLAMDGDEIAGLLRCRPHDDSDPEMGWVSVLGVCRPYRGCGLGLALLQHAFAEFHRRGRLRAGLGVDAENLTGATRLYEKAGMHIERQYSTYELELRPGKELITQAIEN